jgi:hypothetical protein
MIRARCSLLTDNSLSSLARQQYILAVWPTYADVFLVHIGCCMALSLRPVAGDLGPLSLRSVADNLGLIVLDVVSLAKDAAASVNFRVPPATNKREKHYIKTKL